MRDQRVPRIASNIRNTKEILLYNYISFFFLHRFSSIFTGQNPNHQKMATEVITRTGPPGQPDIAYTPNVKTYKARVRRRQETENLSRTLPDGFPQKLESKLAWDGSTVSDQYKWSYELGEAEVTELHEALNKFKGRVKFHKMHVISYSQVQN